PAEPEPTPVASPRPDPNRTEAVVAKYFGDRADDESAGEHTMLLRRAYRQVRTKQRRRYGWVIPALGVLALGIAGFAAYQYQQARQQKAMAQDIFYAMKSLDVDIAGLEKLVLASGGAGADQMKRYRERRREMEQSYDRFLATLHVYDPQMKEPERLRPRLARVVGGCGQASGPGSRARSSAGSPPGASRGRSAPPPTRATRRRSPRSCWRTACRRSSSTSPCRRATSTPSPAGHRPTRASPRGCGSSSRRPR